jgi:hypothetical protein
MGGSAATEEDDADRLGNVATDVKVILAVLNARLNGEL